VVNSLYLNPYELEEHNHKLQKKYDLMIQNETKYEALNLEQAQYIVVAYGTTARIAKNALRHLNEQGHHVGMIRPITLWPFPQKAFANLKNCKGILCVEMNLGQMVEDIKVALNHQDIPVHFFGRTGGVIPEVEEIITAIKNMMQNRKE
jgi:2-oxoglutarate ferredoxin oxidoreductase subunit alpha